MADINTTGNKLRFRWTYIVLPAALLILSLAVAAGFYHLLTAQIAFHFTGDTPDRFLSRGTFIAWMIVPQLLFIFLAFLTVRIAMAGAKYWPADNAPLLRILPVMGNMLALPQIILFIAMLQFFLYNAYQIKPFPLWIIATIILGVGAVFLGVFFVRAIRQNRRRYGKMQRE